KTCMQVKNRDPAEQIASWDCQALCCFVWLQRVINNPNIRYSGFVGETHLCSDKVRSEDLDSQVTGSRLRQPMEASTPAPQNSALVTVEAMLLTADCTRCIQTPLAPPHTHWVSDSICYFLRGGKVLLFVWTRLSRTLENTTDWYIYI
ncbi:unnamed protein product, partial [Bubo scandiacus]